MLKSESLAFCLGVVFVTMSVPLPHPSVGESKRASERAGKDSTSTRARAERMLIVPGVSGGGELEFFPLLRLAEFARW